MMPSSRESVKGAVPTLEILRPIPISRTEAPAYTELLGVMHQVGLAIDAAVLLAREIGDAPLAALIEQMRLEWASRLQALPPLVVALPAYTITLDLHESEEGVLLLGAHSADAALERARAALDTLGYGRARCTGPAGFYREVWAS